MKLFPTAKEAKIPEVVELKIRAANTVRILSCIIGIGMLVVFGYFFK